VPFATFVMKYPYRIWLRLWRAGFFVVPLFGQIGL
jgi:hypothetical protein